MSTKEKHNRILSTTATILTLWSIYVGSRVRREGKPVLYMFEFFWLILFITIYFGNVLIGLEMMLAIMLGLMIPKEKNIIEKR